MNSIKKAGLIIITASLLAIISWYSFNWYAAGLLEDDLLQLIEMKEAEELDYFLSWRDYDLNSEDNNGCTLLHFTDNPQVIHVLLKHGADPNHKGRHHYYSQAQRIKASPQIADHPKLRENKEEACDSHQQLCYGSALALGCLVDFNLVIV